MSNLAGLNGVNNEWYFADWIEFIKPTTIDEEPSYEEVSINFRYGEFTNDEGVSQPLPGLDSDGNSVIIQTSSDIEFKVEDKVTFTLDDGTTVTYFISNVTPVTQRSNTQAGFSFPGITSLYKTKVIRF